MSRYITPLLMLLTVSVSQGQEPTLTPVSQLQVVGPGGAKDDSARGFVQRASRVVTIRDNKLSPDKPLVDEVVEFKNGRSTVQVKQDPHASLLVTADSGFSFVPQLSKPGQTIRLRPWAKLKVQPLHVHHAIKPRFESPIAIVWSNHLAGNYPLPGPAAATPNEAFTAWLGGQPKTLPDDWRLQPKFYWIKVITEPGEHLLVPPGEVRIGRAPKDATTQQILAAASSFQIKSVAPGEVVEFQLSKVVKLSGKLATPWVDWSVRPDNEKQKIIELVSVDNISLNKATLPLLPTSTKAWPAAARDRYVGYLNSRTGRVLRGRDRVYRTQVKGSWFTFNNVVAGTYSLFLLEQQADGRISRRSLSPERPHGVGMAGMGGGGDDEGGGMSAAMLSMGMGGGMGGPPTAFYWSSSTLVRISGQASVDLGALLVGTTDLAATNRTKSKRGGGAASAMAHMMGAGSGPGGSAESDAGGMANQVTRTQTQKKSAAGGAGAMQQMFGSERGGGDGGAGLGGSANNGGGDGGAAQMMQFMNSNNSNNPKPDPLVVLAKKYRQANQQERQQLRRSMEQVLSKAFDEMQATRAKQLDELQKLLQTARQKHGQRDRDRRKIIERRLNSLLGSD